MTSWNGKASAWAASLLSLCPQGMASQPSASRVPTSLSDALRCRPAPPVRRTGNCRTCQHTNPELYGWVRCAPSHPGSQSLARGERERAFCNVALGTHPFFGNGLAAVALSSTRRVGHALVTVHDGIFGSGAALPRHRNLIWLHYVGSLALWVSAQHSTSRRTAGPRVSLIFETCVVKAHVPG